MLNVTYNDLSLVCFQVERLCNMMVVLILQVVLIIPGLRKSYVDHKLNILLRMLHPIVYARTNIHFSREKKTINSK